MDDLREDTFAGIAALMHGSIGVSFPESKRALVSSRLSSRIQRLGMGGFDDYLALISGEEDAGEFQCAVDLLTTNETYFFREAGHFKVLERELSAAKPSTLSVWSAASSFGDEAFSISMLLADMQQAGLVGADWSVLATDISQRVLRSASQGIYPADRLRDVSPERLKRYCLRGEGDAEGSIQIHQRLRDRVRFGQLNLCKKIDVPGTFDAIFLRNVLIYFDVPTKIDVVDRVLALLKPGGLFFIGTAEGRVACKTALRPLAPGVFRKDVV